MKRPTLRIFKKSRPPNYPRRQANTIYDETKADLEKYNDGTIESFSKSYDQNPLNDLDDKFYKLYEDEPLSQIKVKYIRENVNEFATE